MYPELKLFIGGEWRGARADMQVVNPATEEEICRAVESLKVTKLIRSYRGGPAGDLDATVEAIRLIADYAVAMTDRLYELDVNPLVVQADGAIAVDALGADRVRAVMMPCRYTSNRSQEDAAKEAALLGIRYDVISKLETFREDLDYIRTKYNIALDQTRQSSLLKSASGETITR